MYHYAGNNPIKYVDPDGKKILIGIATSDTPWGLTVGEHAFIMYIDPYDPQDSLMLDASGRYGGGRTSDVLDGLQIEITIEAYLEYFETEEKLTVFELTLSYTDENKLIESIERIVGYSWLKCAEKASEVLNKNFSKEIEICRTPIGLLKELEEYKKNNPKKVTVKYYDFKTNKEIEQNEE